MIFQINQCFGRARAPATTDSALDRVRKWGLAFGRGTVIFGMPPVAWRNSPCEYDVQRPDLTVAHVGSCV